MSEYHFESPVKQIPYSQQRVYAKLSNLSYLGDYTDMLEDLPQDKVKIEELHFDESSVSCSVSPIGKVELRIVERDDPKLVKYQATTSPIPLTLWAQILPTAVEACKIKLTLSTELNFFMKGMLQKPLKEGLDKIAEVLASVPY